jgi:hypothetical protein
MSAALRYPPNTLFVGYLPTGITKDALADVFKDAEEIYIRDKGGGGYKSFAHMSFGKYEDMTAALRFNGTIQFGTMICVEIARNKPFAMNAPKQTFEIHDPKCPLEMGVNFQILKQINASSGRLHSCHLEKHNAHPSTMMITATIKVEEFPAGHELSYIKGLVSINADLKAKLLETKRKNCKAATKFESQLLETERKNKALKKEMHQLKSQLLAMDTKNLVLETHNEGLFSRIKELKREKHKATNTVSTVQLQIKEIEADNHNLMVKLLETDRKNCKAATKLESQLLEMERKNKMLEKEMHQLKSQLLAIDTKNLVLETHNEGLGSRIEALKREKHKAMNTASAIQIQIKEIEAKNCEAETKLESELLAMARKISNMARKNCKAAAKENYETGRSNLVESSVQIH